MSVQNNLSWWELKKLATEVVAVANKLKDKRTDEIGAQVSYCAIFCKNNNEYSKLKYAASDKGELASKTETGPVFVVPGITTVAGLLHVIKIRKPDSSRKERGDADFSVANYEGLKAKHLGFPGFKLIERTDFEMIELMDREFDVRVYFSHPPVEKHTGIREVLAKFHKSNC